MENYAEKANQFYKLGELRKAISEYRQALRFEKNQFERSKIYLELTRIYRIMVRMKNARLELMRAFEALGLEWPKNTIYSLVKAYIEKNRLPNLHPNFIQQDKNARVLLLAELYEELGLSAYYLRQNFILIQSTIKSKSICHLLGPSRPLLNWYGGTACVMSLIGFEKKSLEFIKKCHEISEVLNDPKDEGKVLIWKALLYDYNGYPVRSAELFKKCLDDFGSKLDPFDLRLCTVTLSTNYFCRGHFQNALDTLNKLEICNPCFKRKQEKDFIDIVAWYSVGPSLMLGKNIDIEKIVQNFRSIMSTDKDEKWLLTQFLGHLLTAKRKVGLKFHDMEDLVKRFEILEMTPKKAHFETIFYWIAEAYLRFDQALANRSFIPKFKKSLKSLAKTPRHPTNLSHYAVLKTGLALLENHKKEFIYWSQKAADESRIINNQWALQELSKIKELSHDKK